jgi:hypothetical protein
MSKHTRYTYAEVHEALFNRVGATAPPELQVYDCPYFVRLCGVMESDWGVCVNPESPGLGRVLFEHDACFGQTRICPHGKQRTNEWQRKDRDIPPGPSNIIVVSPFPLPPPKDVESQ